MNDAIPSKIAVITIITIKVMDERIEIRKAAPQPISNTVFIVQIQIMKAINKLSKGPKNDFVISIVIPIKMGPTSAIMNASPRVASFPETIRPAMKRTKLVTIHPKINGTRSIITLN